MEKYKIYAEKKKREYLRLRMKNQQDIEEREKK